MKDFGTVFTKKTGFGISIVITSYKGADEGMID